MARIDKYQPLVSGTRVPLDVPFAEADLDKVIAVGLTANGRLVKGAGTTGVIGVVIVTRTSNNAGDVNDVMQNGDIVDTGFAAGSVVSATDAGVVAPVASPGVVPSANSYVGFTVEAGRLVVRFARKDLGQ